MLRRDYLVKQFEEFGKVMAVILGLKREDKLLECLEEINKATQKYTNSEIDFVEGIADEELLKILVHEKQFSDNQLKLLADLLFEKGNCHLELNIADNLSQNCYRKSLQIYLFLKTHATINYSLDMHYKIELLSTMKL